MRRRKGDHSLSLSKGRGKKENHPALSPRCYHVVSCKKKGGDLVAGNLFEIGVEWPDFNVAVSCRPPYLEPLK